MFRTSKALSHTSGFTLIQLSLMLTVISIAMVAVLPSSPAKINTSASSVSKMNAILKALRQYELQTCALPCPADPTLPNGNINYGIAAANGGASGNCMGSIPQAGYADSTNHIAIGMVPVKTLGLSSDYALDNWGRDVTYAIDTTSTAPWTSTSLPGAVTILDNGITHNSVVALISHGQDGYGAWLPLTGTSGVARRVDNGSVDPAQANNAQVVTGGGLTANTTFANFTNKTPTATFDDNVVYDNGLWGLNTMPILNNAAMTYPINGNYGTGDILKFGLNKPSAMTVNGTPALDLSALSGGVISANNATYASGGGTGALAFTYTVQASDHALNGIAVTAPLDTSHGSVSACTPFNAPNLSGVVLNKGVMLVADAINNRVRETDLSGNWMMDIGNGTFGSSDQLFNNVIDVKVDPSGNIWALDAYNNRVMKYSSGGVWQLTIGGTASQSCSGQWSSSTTCTPLSGNSACCAPNAASCSCSTGASAGQFSFNVLGVTCGGLAFDPSGDLWVADCYNNRVQEFNSSTGSFMKQFAVANGPNGIAVDSAGNVWTSQPNPALLVYNTIEKCTAAGVCTQWNGNPGTTGTYGYMAFDPNGNLWVAGGTDCTIHEFNSSGAVSGTVTLTSSLCSLLDLHQSLVGVAFDLSGKMWVSDYHTNNVYQINTSTGAIVQSVGTGTAGYAILPIIKFSGPLGIAIGGR